MCDFFEAVDALNREQGEPTDDVRLNTGDEPTLIPSLEPYWKTYTSKQYRSKMMPLRIVIKTDGVMAGYDSPTCDGILAHLVVDEALEGDDLDEAGGPYLLPVPLFQLWMDPKTGLPLWACNNFAPVGPSEEIAFYWHKRTIRPEHAKKRSEQRTPYAYKGRHKEKRVPTPAQTAKTWFADCIGHRDEVARLFEELEVIGKRRKALVRSVEVRRLDNFKMRRPVPLRYFNETTNVEPHGQKGWTPPYWAGVPQVQAECGVPV